MSTSAAKVQRLLNRNQCCVSSLAAITSASEMLSDNMAP
jgi:hypothetical protein